MLKSIVWQTVLCLQLIVNPTLGGSTPPREAQYNNLPSLRESAEIQDAWTKERIENIPNILQKWGVDAWLVKPSLSSPAEYTTFFSCLPCLQFVEYNN